jgi:serine/threonine protein kinase
MTTHPDEPELLSVAAGEPKDDAIVQHVKGCELCNGRVERLRHELSILPSDLDEGLTADPIGTGSATGAEGKPSVGPTELFPMVTTRDLAESPPERPVAIGKYLVIELLDRGGEADVYLVIHPNLGKEMVLKLSRHPADGDELGNLVREGKVLAELDHINLVRVFDSGFHDDRPFLVMEYVHGRNLEDYARDEPLTPRRAAELVAKLAAALTAVHRKDIIHRDITPRNIVIDERDEPVLIDFGLARLRNAWSDPFATTWGGTPPFMPPEQARREHDRVGRRSDLFGLGAVLYFLLTRQPPFVGETYEEILDRAQRSDFEAGALRAAKVPRRLERICLKSLAADPADRYATADDMGRALNRYLRRPATLVGGSLTLLVVAMAAAIATAASRGRRPHDSQPPPTVLSKPLPAATVASAPELQSLVKVDRHGMPLELPDALPLRTGDRVWIECMLPSGWGASAFWYDSEGHLTELKPSGRVRKGASDQFSYPIDGACTLVGPAGTEFIFVCARPSTPPRQSELAGLFSEGRRWPSLADNELILLDHDRVTITARVTLSPGPTQASAARELVKTLESLRMALADKFGFVAGVSFPHRDPSAQADPSGHPIK